jgi:diguanylate cyclase (GGDEF)-like protein/PAS domain S-box-containing protein
VRSETQSVSTKTLLSRAGKVGSHSSAVAALLCMWLIGIVGATAVLVLIDRLDSRRQSQIVVSDLRSLVEEAPGIPFQADPDLGDPSVARAKLASDHERFGALVDALWELNPGSRVHRIEDVGDRYYAALGASLSLVAAGDPERAGRQVVGLGRDDGVQVELRSLLNEQSSDGRSEAGDAEQLAEVGAWLAVVLTLIAFSFALYRATRSRLRAEALAVANDALLRHSRAEEERYRDLFENANEPIATVDLEWSLTDVNAAFAKALGRSREELLGTKLGEYLTEDAQVLSSLHRDRKLAGDELASTYEQTFVTPDGRTVIFEVSTRLIEEDGKPTGVQGMCRDVTARKDAEERLRQMAELNRYQAHHDALTGLPNRLAFHDEVERAIAASRRRGPFAVVLVDLDRFKQINDSLGHGAGDLLLQQLSSKLRDVLPTRSGLARLGGDEFGVLLHGLSEASGGWADALDAIKAVFDEPQLIDGVPVAVEASIGVAVHPTHGRGVDELLRRAEVAMYVAKGAGRGHAVYTADEDSNDAGKLALLGELRRAISDHELVVHYQPIVDPRTNVTAKVEALLRWNHPQHGLIPPSEFLPLAETTGLIKPLTRYVLGEATRHCRRLDEAGYAIDVSVNLSTRNLSESDLVEDVRLILASADVDPSRITLEITESAVMSDPEGTRRVLERLGELGVKIALDDFGAGYTSLSQLAHLPIHEIKIDRSFIADLLTDAHGRAIVCSILSLSHDLDLEVVAEGVEGWDVLTDLRELGCDLVQGYFFSCPLSAETLSEWLAQEALPQSGRAA